ncbi:hypothetical protein TYRP_002326 [Tyrophagus putrescentiae]|nr:hypothetical protein TYRP_002326 [Tyrophagus putrescentiae]
MGRYPSMNASKNLFSEPMVELSWIYGLLIIFFLFAIISLVHTQFLWRNKRVAKISSS